MCNSVYMFLLCFFDTWLNQSDTSDKQLMIMIYRIIIDS